MKLLAADIGGTSTRLIYAELQADEYHLIAEHVYASSQYDNFLQVLDRFITEYIDPVIVDAACFAVAGPVGRGSVKLTNLPWLIRHEELVARLGTRKVALVNDFTAVAFGIDMLSESDVIYLQGSGRNTPATTPPSSVVIGAGTGLGVAHRVWLDGHYTVLPSESGHCGFAPENELQIKLLTWMRKQYPHVSLESLLSGQGLVRIYQFLYENMPEQASDETNHALSSVSDPAQLISELALAGDDHLCCSALDCFVDIYGSAAGNATLSYYPVDEVYIAGGIAPKIKDRLLQRDFVSAFCNKGLMSDNLEQVTIKLVMQEKVGLLGALSQAKALALS